MRRAQKHGMMATVTVTGRIIVAQRDCRNCAQELPDDSRFCSYCGTSILEAAPILEAAHVPTPEAEVPEDPLQQIVQAHLARTAKEISAEPWGSDCQASPQSSSTA